MSRSDAFLAGVGAALCVIGSAWAWTPGVDAGRTVGPVYTRDEAMQACAAYVHPRMEMECRQAARDTPGW